MRVGLIASTAGHIGVILWGLVALPSTKPFDAAPVDTLPVELVPLSEVTKLRLGEKTAELREEEALKPAEKPTEKPEPEAKKPGEAKPDQSATPAAPPPAPEPPKPAPPAPQKPAAETPVRKVEDVAKAEAKPAAEPAPKEPEKPTPAQEPSPAKVAQAKPVNVKPRSKPTPPKPTPPSKDAPKKEFDPTQMAALLNKIEPSGGGANSNQPASLGSRKGQSNVKMSQSELDALRGQISKCWNPPIGAAGASDLTVRVKIHLTQSGDVDTAPEVLNSSSNPSFRAAADSAKRAVLRCAPYNLPASKYGAWKEVIVNFDPRELLGG